MNGLRTRAPKFGPEQTATLLGWALVVIALTTLAGWTFHLPVLIRIVPEAGTMKANTAVSFLVAGLALIRRNRRDFHVYPVLLLVIAGLTTLQAITKSNFGID